MTELQMATYLEHYKDYVLPNDQITEAEIEEALLRVSGTALSELTALPFRSPALLKIISIFPGGIGVDRFMLGDIKNGIIKYFTFGGFGIWWIKDIITAKDRCRNYNASLLINALERLPVAKSDDNGDNVDAGEMIGVIEAEKDRKRKAGGIIALAVGKGAISIGKSVGKGVRDFQDSMTPRYDD